MSKHTSPLWSLVTSCFRWFIGVDESYVRGLADDLGFDARQYGSQVRLIERETRIAVGPMTFEEAERFLDLVEQRTQQLHGSQQERVTR